MRFRWELSDYWYTAKNADEFIQKFSNASDEDRTFEDDDGNLYKVTVQLVYNISYKKLDR